MKCILIPALLLTTTLLGAEDRKITGTFESVLDMPDFVDQKVKDSFEKSKQTITITEKDLTLRGVYGSIHMTYTTQGDFFLGKSIVGQTEMFYPIYVKDADTLFLAGQKFVRTKENSK